MFHTLRYNIRCYVLLDGGEKKTVTIIFMSICANGNFFHHHRI